MKVALLIVKHMSFFTFPFPNSLRCEGITKHKFFKALFGRDVEKQCYPFLWRRNYLWNKNFNLLLGVLNIIITALSRTASLNFQDRNVSCTTPFLVLLIKWICLFVCLRVGACNVLDTDLIVKACTLYQP